MNEVLYTLLVLARDGEPLLSYLELLFSDLEMQVTMEDFVQNYHLSESIIYHSNLDYIRI
jgi:hypothetical protein